jgi:hypothetical protein
VATLIYFHIQHLKGPQKGAAHNATGDQAAEHTEVAQKIEKGMKM